VHEASRLVVSLGSVCGGEWHTADPGTRQAAVNLSEVLRVIQFFNSSGLHCADNQADTEDGYVPRAGSKQSAAVHPRQRLPAQKDWRYQPERIRFGWSSSSTSTGYHFCPTRSTEDRILCGPVAGIVPRPPAD